MEFLAQANLFTKITFSDKSQSRFKFRNRFVNFSMIRTAETVLKLTSEQLIKYSLH